MKHLFAARKIHEIVVRLMAGGAEAALASLQDDGELHCAVHDALAGVCAQEWIDQQLSEERALRRASVPSPDGVREALAVAEQCIKDCATMFYFYEDQHLRKTPPDIAKANTNKQMADKCEVALRALSPSDAGQGDSSGAGAVVRETGNG